MERCDRLGIIQRIAAAFPATLNSDVEGRAKDDIVSWHTQCLEWLQEPRSDDAVHNNEIAALGISFCHSCQNIDDDTVLLVGPGQIGRDRAMLDEMPEVVGMKMHLR